MSTTELRPAPHARSLLPRPSITRRRLFTTTAGHYILWALALLVIVGPVVPVVPVAVASFWSTPLYDSGGT